jgi:hypothetical protein
MKYTLGGNRPEVKAIDFSNNIEDPLVHKKPTITSNILD